MSDRVQNLTETEFGPVAPFYDLLMEGVPYADWVIYLHQLLERRGFNPKKILDLACGTGNVSGLLSREGRDVTGVDISPGMIEEAKRKATEDHLPIDYFVQDAAELSLPEKSFDLCVSLFDSLNYIIEPDRLEKAIRRVAAHLRTGGLFIFDVNTEYALSKGFFDQDNLSTSEPLKYDWISEYDLEKRLCRIDMKFWHWPNGQPGPYFEETHWQYAYRQEELISMLELAGFEQIEVFQAYTLRLPSKTSDRHYYVAEKVRQAPEPRS